MNAKWRRRFAAARYLALGMVPGFGPLAGDLWHQWEVRTRNGRR